MVLDDFKGLFGDWETFNHDSGLSEKLVRIKRFDDEIFVRAYIVSQVILPDGDILLGYSKYSKVEEDLCEKEIHFIKLSQANISILEEDQHSDLNASNSADEELCKLISVADKLQKEGTLTTPTADNLTKDEEQIAFEENEMFSNDIKDVNLQQNSEEAEVHPSDTQNKDIETIDGEPTTIEGFQKTYCVTCGSQRCPGTKSAISTCKHYDGTIDEIEFIKFLDNEVGKEKLYEHQQENTHNTDTVDISTKTDVLNSIVDKLDPSKTENLDNFTDFNIDNLQKKYLDDDM